MYMKISKKQNRVVVLAMLSLGLFIVIGTSFALWNITLRQTSTNKINTSCFKINFSEHDDINIQDAYPISDDDAKKLSPYTFTITNICNTKATFQVNLEELELEGKKLSSQYIKLSLNEKVAKLSTFEEVNKTLDNATFSHKLTTGVLKENEEKTFHLRLWISSDTPSTEEIMNASFLSKITVITVYQKNIPEVNSKAYENLDTIKIDVNTISNKDNETLNYYYQLDDNDEVKSSLPNYTFSNLQDGIYKIKVRVEDTNGIIIYEKEEDVVVAYFHIYISSTGNDTTGNGSTTSPYATLQRAYNKVKSGGEIILLSDITATSTTNMNIANKEVTLKSNGENIYSVTKASTLKSGILNIDNSNTITTINIIFDGNNVSSTNSLIESRSSILNLNKGTTVKRNIHTGGYNRDLGDGWCVGSGVYSYNGTLNINGATISDNQLNGPDVGGSLGGGILSYNSVINFNSGNVLRNEGNWDGGGIAVLDSTLNMNGGIVSLNKSVHGAGILVYAHQHNSSMIINDGEISNNTATVNCGGVLANSETNLSSIVHIKGGIIKNNIAPHDPDIYTNGGQIIDER